MKLCDTQELRLSERAARTKTGADRLPVSGVIGSGHGRGVTAGRSGVAECVGEVGQTICGGCRHCVATRGSARTRDMARELFKQTFRLPRAYLS